MKVRWFVIFFIVVSLVGYFYWDNLTEPSYLHQVTVSSDNQYFFEGIKGPTSVSSVAEPVPASWKSYQTNNPSALVILLTDTSSDWLGLVHGFKNIGIPFTLTDNIQEAIRHHTIMVYPVISGKVLSMDNLKQLAAVPRNGGNLIGVNVYGGGLNVVFGFEEIIPANNRSQLLLTNNLPEIMSRFTHPNEQVFNLFNPKDFPDKIHTNGYTNASTPLIIYGGDSTAMLTYKDYGVGKAFAFGVDLGNYFLRYMNGRGFNANKTYANHYEPGMDVILRIIKKIYEFSPVGVTLGTVPFDKDFTLVITHDIDYTKSIVNMVTYARMEHKLGVTATYFIQTKYIKDWNDDIFFKKETIKYLKEIYELGMEIGSHSVSHSRTFSKFPLGSGKESYPRYKPFVQELTKTYNGSILGELRVSKYLLEQTIPGCKIVSFRPGYLQYPFTLPQALAATGYSYSSSITANKVQTHLPYMQTYNREYTAETDNVEMPITIEDELDAPLLQRLDSTLIIADALSTYGGLMNVLIHTDITGQKLQFEQQLIIALRSRAYIATIQMFGKWWWVRNKVQVKVKVMHDEYHVEVIPSGKEEIEGLTLHVPLSWKFISAQSPIIVNRGSVIIQKLSGNEEIVFRKE